MTRGAALLLVVFMLTSCAGGRSEGPVAVVETDGCQVLAKVIDGATALPEPTGQTRNETGLKAVTRSGGFEEHSPADPLEAVRVFTGEGTTVVDVASLLFVFSESGRASFGGCVATDGRVGDKTIPVADPDPKSPLAVVLDRVLVGASSYNADLSSAFALVNANGRAPWMFGKAVPNALPTLVSATFDQPTRLTLTRNPDAHCEPRCLGIGMFVFDVRGDGGSISAKQVAARIDVSVPPTGLGVDLPGPPPRTLRVAVAVTGTGQQGDVDPMYAFTAQIMA